MKPKTTLLCVVLLLAAWLFVACGGGGSSDATPAPETTPKPKPASSSAGAVTATGRIMPAKQANLSFAASGPVAEVLAQPGQKVNQGDVLARLGPDMQAQSELAAAQYELLQAQQASDALTANLDVARTDALKALHDAEQEQYDAQRNAGYQATPSTTFVKTQADRRLEIANQRVTQAQARMDLLKDGPDAKKVAEANAHLASAQARVDAAQATIAALELKAPFAGTVVKVNSVAGEQATPGQTAMVLADLENWVAQTDDLTEIKVVKITPGQPVVMVPDALPDVRVNGTVKDIGKMYEEKRGDVTYTATINIPDMDPRLMWGMTVVINFQQ